MSIRILPPGWPALAVLLLGACGSPAYYAAMGKPHKGYIGPERPLGEVAVVKFMNGGDRPLQGQLLAYGEGDTKFALSDVHPGASELRLPPGVHTVQVRCHNAGGEARPYLKLDLLAGSTYELGCSITGVDSSKARVGVLAVTSTPAAAR